MSRLYPTTWETMLFILLLTALPAWLTHIFVCIKSEQWIFLLAGAICAPIAVVHGWGVWLGVW